MDLNNSIVRETYIENKESFDILRTHDIQPNGLIKFENIKEFCDYVINNKR